MFIVLSYFKSVLTHGPRNNLGTYRLESRVSSVVIRIKVKVYFGVPSRKSLNGVPESPPLAVGLGYVKHKPTVKNFLRLTKNFLEFIV